MLPNSILLYAWLLLGKLSSVFYIGICCVRDKSNVFNRWIFQMSVISHQRKKLKLARERKRVQRLTCHVFRKHRRCYDTSLRTKRYSECQNYLMQ